MGAPLWLSLAAVVNWETSGRAGHAEAGQAKSIPWQQMPAPLTFQEMTVSELENEFGVGHSPDYHTHVSVPSSVLRPWRYCLRLFILLARLNTERTLHRFQTAGVCKFSARFWCPSKHTEHSSCEHGMHSLLLLPLLWLTKGQQS